MNLPVLGQWENEAGLRDYLAEHLELIEPNLDLIKTEHTLPNLAGSGGRVDILAADSLGNYVCIEVKRSDNSARATLNEFSKYLALLCQEHDVQKERVRCVLVSTHWHEVLLPLSNFAEICGADVSGYKAKMKCGALSLDRQALKKITFSTQISPEVCVMYFKDEATRKQYFDLVEMRAAQLPFVKIALLCLNPKPNSKFVDCVVIAYIWKIPSDFYSDLEQVIGEEIGWLPPYAHPEAKAEADASYWIFEAEDKLSTYYSSSARFGTPEKVTSLLQRFAFEGIKKIGRWPANDPINTDEKLLSQMVSFSPMKGGSKQNNYIFSARSNPILEKGYSREVNDFLDFLSFSKVFKSAAKEFLETLRGKDVEVALSANRGRNAFIDLYLSRRRGSSQIASFQIIVSVDGKPSTSLVGGFYWDGQTFPQDAASNMDVAFGGTAITLLQAFSSSEWNANQDSMKMHGLIPVVFRISENSQTLVSRGGKIDSQIRPFDDFTWANEAYLTDLAQEIERASDLGSQDLSR